MTGLAVRRKIAAEFSGTAFLLATVIGSGVMGERLSGGNEALALLGNTLATGAILAVIVTMFAPISGAHFNPVVTLALFVKKEIGQRLALYYVAAQILGAIAGVAVAHVMFDLPLFTLSQKIRSGTGQDFAEFIATFGLLTTILLTRKVKPDFLPGAIGLYISAAYWFTASTSFANPAVTIARTLSNTFAGIRADNAPFFIIAQTAGAMAAVLLCSWLLQEDKPAARAAAPAVTAE